RVYIIERADTLNEPTANSLLKALEEPPPYALFILLAPHSGRLLPTILSRAQMIRLSPSPVDALADYLAETQGISADRARTIASYAEGRTGAALDLARRPAVQAEMDKVIDFAMTIPAATPLRALKLAEGLRKLSAGFKALGVSGGLDAGEP